MLENLGKISENLGKQLETTGRDGAQRCLILKNFRPTLLYFEKLTPNMCRIT